MTLGKTGKITYLGTVGNVRDDGSVAGREHRETRYQTGNQLWHSDSSFREVPSTVSITHAYEVPGEGGATEFASMRAAYERLDAERQAEFASLRVVHDYVFSRSKVAPVDPNHAASLPPVTHPLVRVNPGNGRKNYYVGSHARSVVGWSGFDSRRLLDALLEEATRPEDILAYQWRAGDTVILGQPLPAPPRHRLRCRPLAPADAPDPRGRQRTGQTSALGREFPFFRIIFRANTPLYEAGRSRVILLGRTGSRAHMWD